MRRKALTHPDRFDLTRLGEVWTVRKFDDMFTEITWLESSNSLCAATMSP